MKAPLTINHILALCFLLQAAMLQAQESKTFYDTRVVNGQSVEMNQPGILKFIIAHRFGRVNQGASDLFGLDNATIRLGLDYGISDWLTVGVGRSSFEKTYDGFVKARLLKQQKGEKNIPISLVAFSSIAINTSEFADPVRDDLFRGRLAYSYQLLIARRINDRLSLQLMPSLVHRNVVRTEEENNDVYALGGAFRYVINKRLTLSAEHYFVFPDQLTDEFHNSLAIGLNIETKGHVFQLHFGNSRGMIEKFFISETTGEWTLGDIHFGFNFTRDFKLRGRKY